MRQRERQRHRCCMFSSNHLNSLANKRSGQHYILKIKRETNIRREKLWSSLFTKLYVPNAYNWFWLSFSTVFTLFCFSWGLNSPDCSKYENHSLEGRCGLKMFNKLFKVTQLLSSRGPRWNLNSVLTLRLS